MQSEIICIGDELLIGQTVNTNAAWLGEQLNLIGIRVHRCTNIADNAVEIVNALNEASSRSKVVIITGGLGPTKDDITKHTLCRYFNTELVMNEEALTRIEGFFKERGLPMLEVNRLQAALPASCKVIQNYRGTACGMWFEKNGVVFISMPGVPYEMQSMMGEQVFPALQEKFERPLIVHRTILTIGAGESSIADMIKEWENSLGNYNIGLAYLPSPGSVKLRMSLYEADPLKAESILDRKEGELKKLIGNYIYGKDKQTLQEVVGDLLRERKAKLSVAESCTGGFISHLITSIAGSSDYYEGGITTYTEAVKIAELKVDPEVIKVEKVVSAAVAEAMAEGCRKKFNTEFSLATTGVAGPSGGDEKNPVGTVWIAVSGPNGVKSQRFKFSKNREINIRMASEAALNLLRKEILTING